jgi:cytochrome b561
MAILICVDLFIASKLGREMAEADHIESRGDQSILGMIVAALLVARVTVRLAHGSPPKRRGISLTQVRAAKLGYGLLYAVMTGLVVTLLLTALNATNPIVIFQSVTLSIGNVGGLNYGQLDSETLT